MKPFEPNPERFDFLRESTFCRGEECAIRALLEHVSSLEAFLPKLKPSKVSVPDYKSARVEGGRTDSKDG